MSFNHYAHNTHWEWVQRQPKVKVPMSDLGKAVANVLGFVGRGLYNAPINVEKVDWSSRDILIVSWRGDLTNWDMMGLSALWIECHRRMLRVTIAPGGPRCLRLEFFQRKSREGDISRHLPDCEDMIALVDGFYGRNQPEPKPEPADPHKHTRENGYPACSRCGQTTAETDGDELCAACMEASHA